jgi:predicted transcriptional regulator
VARPALAQRYLQPAAEFGVRSLTLFAARGIGKTEFLKRDLIPLARERDFACVYADVWEMSEGPSIAIARALEQWNKQEEARGTAERLAERARALLGTPITHARGEIDLLGHKASVEANFESARPRAGEQDTERLISAFRAFLKKVRRKPVLLVIDEAQTLSSPRFEPLVKTLRAIFEAHDEQIVRMYTGSSRMGLDRMFRRSHAPLFGQGGTMGAFPPLDRDFIRQICDWFSQRTGGADLGEKAAWQGFQRLQHSARLFRSAVESVLIGQSTHIEAACERVRFDLLDDERLKGKLAALSPLQWDVLHSVWRHGTDLYSAVNLKRLTQKIGEEVDMAKVQSALQRLERMELIYRIAHGEYRIELPELELVLEDLSDLTAKAEKSRGPARKT